MKIQVTKLSCHVQWKTKLNIIEHEINYCNYVEYNNNHPCEKEVHFIGMWRDLVARSDWSRENVRVSWGYPCKTFCSVYIRTVTLIVKNCDLASNNHTIFFLNDSALSIVTHEKHVLSLPMLMNQRVGHHYASDVNWTLSFTDMGGDKTCAALAPLMLTMWDRC